MLTVRSRLTWSPITQVLAEHFDALAGDIDATLKLYRGERALPDGFDRDWLQGVLQAHPQLQTLTRQDIREWLALAAAVEQLFQTMPSDAYTKLPWPNAPFARSKIDLELNDLRRRILWDPSDMDVQEEQERARHLDQEVLRILELWRDQGTLEQWQDRGEEACLREMARMLEITGHSSPAPDTKRHPRRARFKGHLNALRVVLVQGTWPHQSIADTPLYELLLLRMREAFLRYGSPRWTDTFIDHAMVKILRQVGLEDLGAPERIVDRLRKRIERFENHLSVALKALEERRRRDQRERHDSSGERTA
jgi:hypothetical protein